MAQLEIARSADPVARALRLARALPLELVSPSGRASAEVVAIGEGLLVVTLGDGTLLPSGLLSATLDAFDQRWQWTRLECTRSEDETWILTSDDAHAVARLWSLSYAARRAGRRNAAQAKDQVETEIPFRGYFSRDKTERRMAWLRTRSGHDLPALTSPRLDAGELRGNIEHFAGSVEIPVGLVGPLRILGENASGYFVAPFATTEGALVASATRGAKALTLSGGVVTHVIHKLMTRSPVFVMKNSASATRLSSWLLDHLEGLVRNAAAASHHARLLRIEPVPIGRYLHVTFVYETGDAAGQNMTTICTWRACGWARAELAFDPDMAIDHFFIEGNSSGDKKVSHLGSQTRGTRVSAEAFLSKSIVKSVFKVSPRLLLEAFEAGVVGSLYAGTTGLCVNIANVVAAIFTSTGQDIACVHESSAAQLHLSAQGDGIAATLLIPGLVVGTVGGGTGLPGQLDALRVLGCEGAGHSRRLAEIIAGFALALELSTLSSIASGDFVVAHEVLGRPRDDAGLRDADLTPAFFENCLRGANAFEGATLKVCGVTALESAEGDSVLGQLIAAMTRDKLGVFPFELDLRVRGEPKRLKVALKSKPRDIEVVRAVKSLARMCGEPIASLYEAHAWDVGFRQCHVRELRIAAMKDPRFIAIAPRTYFTFHHEPEAGDPRAICLLAMEHLDDVSHFGAAEDASAWRRGDIEAALDGLASFHAVHLGRTAALVAEPWIDVVTPARMQKLSPLFAAVAEQNATEFPELYTATRVDGMLRWLGDVRTHWENLETSPLTLVHNDFNPRNVALRRVAGGGVRLCAFDWELATVHSPQRDLCEFLAWVIDPGEPAETRAYFLDFFHACLERHCGQTVPWDVFFGAYRIACMDFAVSRLGMYTVAAGFRAFGWLRRVLASHFAALDAT